MCFDGIVTKSGAKVQIKNDIRKNACHFLSLSSLLIRLSDEPHVFEADIKKDFPVNIYPTEEIFQRYKVADLDNCCFLCSEETPEHCHRRLLAEYLKQQDPENVKIVHLV